MVRGVLLQVAQHLIKCSVLRVEGLGFGVWGLRCRILDLRSRVGRVWLQVAQPLIGCLGLRVEGLGLRVEGLGLRV